MRSMNDKWLTVLPLQNLWGKPAKLPATFAAGVSLQEIPPMLVVQDKHDRLRSEFIRRRNHATHAIVVEYTAAAKDESQQRAVYQAHLALFALWLVRPTPLYTSEVGHFRIEGIQVITREVASLQPFNAHPSYSQAKNEPADFAEAAKLHGYMNNGANEGVVRVAINVAMGALETCPKSASTIAVDVGGR